MTALKRIVKLRASGLLGLAMLVLLPGSAATPGSRQLQESAAATCLFNTTIGDCNATLDINTLWGAGNTADPSVLAQLTCLPAVDLNYCLNELVRGEQCGCDARCKALIAPGNATCILQVQNVLFCQYQRVPNCISPLDAFAAIIKRCTSAEQYASVQSMLGTCGADSAAAPSPSNTTAANDARAAAAPPAAPQPQPARSGAMGVCMQAFLLIVVAVMSILL